MEANAELLQKLQRQRRRMGELTLLSDIANVASTEKTPEMGLRAGKVKQVCLEFEGSENQSAALSSRGERHPHSPSFRTCPVSPRDLLEVAQSTTMDSRCGRSGNSCSISSSSSCCGRPAGRDLAGVTDALNAGEPGMRTPTSVALLQPAAVDAETVEAAIDHGAAAALEAATPPADTSHSFVCYVLSDGESEASPGCPQKSRETPSPFRDGNELLLAASHLWQGSSDLPELETTWPSTAPVGRRDDEEISQVSLFESMASSPAQVAPPRCPGRARQAPKLRAVERSACAEARHRELQGCKGPDAREAELLVQACRAAVGRIQALTHQAERAKEERQGRALTVQLERQRARAREEGESRAEKQIARLEGTLRAEARRCREKDEQRRTLAREVEALEREVEAQRARGGRQGLRPRDLLDGRR
eukprot:CAMPEP_0168361700 /NCGR_PEP_ID=MMETSP0228-20121227/2799_1 /TAXON_ID=133427 /ORGANISM="Protoceratium reticulatum, Strain CCCM 535 (=CCMP 1889)" /LENGTH=420 /DNA_ID=CAMNT_0008374381 /DNA_START=50 /DNA_END=1309 /DNA_ORIENTATION=-